MSLTPHGAFETPLAPDPDPDDGRRRVLAFGKFGTYKRVDDLIVAHRELRERGGYDDVELVIAGTDSPNARGYLAGVEAECADLPGVRFTGYVAEEDVAELFESCSVVVFPYTATTGSSGPLHQAGAHGRAVVAPRLGDFLDLIEHEGYCAEPFTPGEPGQPDRGAGRRARRRRTPPRPRPTEPRRRDQPPDLGDLRLARRPRPATHGVIP